MDLRDVTDSTVAELLSTMRERDRKEILRTGFECSREAVETALMAADVSQALYIEGKLAAVWGFVLWATVTQRASPFVFTTRVVNRHPRDFIRMAQHMVQSLGPAASEWEWEFMIDVEYTGAWRLAQRLGFRLEGPYEYGPARWPFLRALLAREAC